MGAICPADSTRLKSGAAGWVKAGRLYHWRGFARPASKWRYPGSGKALVYRRRRPTTNVPSFTFRYRASQRLQAHMPTQNSLDPLARSSCGRAPRASTPLKNPFTGFRFVAPFSGGAEYVHRLKIVCPGVKIADAAILNQPAGRRQYP